jgi:hypothetical protein
MLNISLEHVKEGVMVQTIRNREIKPFINPRFFFQRPQNKQMSRVTNCCKSPSTIVEKRAKK